LGCWDIAIETMSRHVVRIAFVAFEVKEEMIDEYLLVLCVVKDNGHRIRVASQQVGRHDQCQIGRCHFRDNLDFLLQEQLQEADDEKHNPPINSGQSLHHLHARNGVLRVSDAVVVQLLGYEWIAQLPKPQFQKRCEDVRILDIVKGVVPAIDAQFEFRDRIPVAWDTKYSFRFRAAKSKHAICEEGEDNWDFLVGIIALL